MKPITPEDRYEARFNPQMCAVCLEDAWDYCRACECWLCDKHIVKCAECGPAPDEDFRYCVDCLLALPSAKGKYPPMVLVNGKWLCENCIPEDAEHARIELEAA